jgi:hypothetical protein
MSKMKNWMMDMEEYTVSAIECGATYTSEVVAFVNTKMSVVDEKFVVKKTKELMGASIESGQFDNG